MAPARDSRFDNAKGFLIILVVLGHALMKIPETYGWRGGGLWAAHYGVIYMVHMPAFVFISGYLSSKEKPFLANIRDVFLLYILAQAAWCTYLFSLSFIGGARPLIGETFLALPSNGLWYLLVLFVWRVSTPALAAVRFPLLALAALIAYGAGMALVNNVAGEFSLSRLITFLPFFAAGFWSRHDGWFFTRPSLRPADWLLLGVAAVAAPIVFWVAYHNTFDLLTLSGPTISAGLQLRGVAFRLVHYVVAFGAIRLLFILIPARSSLLTTLGLNSLSIYIGHFYVLQPLWTYVDARFWQANMAWMAPLITITCCALFCRFQVGELLRRLAVRLYNLSFQPGDTDRPAPNS